MEKIYISTQQAEEIRILLDKRLKTKDKEEQKKIASQLRNHGFFISKFNKNFSSSDFDKEIEKGTFIILNSPIIYENNISDQQSIINNLNQEKKKNNYSIIAILIFLIIAWLIGTLTQNNNETPEVIKGKKYNSSYDNQIEDLKRDLNKSADWVEGIVIYDENCDTVASINRN